MIYADLVVFSPPFTLTLRLLQMCCGRGGRTPLLCAERELGGVGKLLLGAVCILGENMFHRSLGERRVAAWPICFRDLVTVLLLTQSGELDRPAWCFGVVK